ncbi:MAG: hypothetical protein ACHQII_07800 [Bacteroidia bacterium]
MKKNYLLVCLIFLFACGSDTKQQDKKLEVVKDYLLADNYVAKLVAQNHEKIKDTKGDFASFKTYVDKLPNDSLVSIAYALDYLNNCNLTNDSTKNSAYMVFRAHFYVAMNELSTVLDTKYKFLLDVLAKDSTTTELAYFKNNLAACGVGIFSTEGNFYVDELPYYFYDTFKDRVPAETKEYLAIHADELKKGFSEDAGLLISFDELYNRIKKWEAFMAKYPNSTYTKELKLTNALYIETLLTGMDNSRLFNFDSNTLLPEIKTLYEKIMKDDPASATTKIVTSYYNILARHDFNQNDSLDIFLKANDLTSMLGVQPPTR